MVFYGKFHPSILELLEHRWWEINQRSLVEIQELRPVADPPGRWRETTGAIKAPAGRRSRLDRQQSAFAVGF